MAAHTRVLLPLTFTAGCLLQVVARMDERRVARRCQAVRECRHETMTHAVAVMLLRYASAEVMVSMMKITGRMAVLSSDVAANMHHAPLLLILSSRQASSVITLIYFRDCSRREQRV